MIYLTLPSLGARASLKLRHLHRFPPRPTDAAVDGIFYDQGPEDLMPVAAVDLEDERVTLRVLPTGPAPAETTRRQRGPFAYPAIHSSVPRDCLP